MKIMLSTKIGFHFRGWEILWKTLCELILSLLEPTAKKSHIRFELGTKKKKETR